LCIDAESREEVKEIIDTAEKSGGSIYMEASDHGWMYQHSFADLDGHQWEVAHMDMSKFPQS
jgi:predicted lactoylglutathione lyase